MPFNSREYLRQNADEGACSMDDQDALCALMKKAAL
jgi:hypothetical protein